MIILFSSVVSNAIFLGSRIAEGEFHDSVVFDLIGGDTLKKVRSCVKDGGRLVSIVEDPGTHFPEETKVDLHFVFIEPNVRELDHIRKPVESGELKSHIRAVLKLDDVVEAHAQMETGHTRGKIVLKI